MYTISWPKEDPSTKTRTVKVFFPDDDIRRFNVKHQTTYDELIAKLLTFNKNKEEVDSLKIWYKDDEGDWIRFDTEEGLIYFLN